jgi:hypothetical protein
MFGIDKNMLGLYAVVLVISFSYKLLFRYYGHRYYEKAWAFIHQKFPKVSDRFNPSFYFLFLYCWISIFFIAVIFHMAGNTVAEYVFLAVYVFLTSPVMMFLNVWENDQNRNDVVSGRPAVHQKKGFYIKVFLSFVGAGVVIIGGWTAFNYYVQVYGPNECSKLAATKDLDLRRRLTADGKTLGLTASGFDGNKCYETITYTYSDKKANGLTAVYSYIEDLRSGEVLSVCPPQSGLELEPSAACAEYDNDFRRLFLHF